MTAQTAAEREMAELLIGALNMTHLQADQVDPTAPLFSNTGGGWGLDSIDALEIALALQQQYGVELRSEDEQVKPAFASLRTLTELIVSRRA